MIRLYMKDVKKFLGYSTVRSAKDWCVKNSITVLWDNVRKKEYVWCPEFESVYDKEPKMVFNKKFKNSIEELNMIFKGKINHSELESIEGKVLKKNSSRAKPECKAANKLLKKLKF